jgi:hypothetical protein
MMPIETVIAARAPTTPRTPAAWRAYARLRRSPRVAVSVAIATDMRRHPHGRPRQADSHARQNPLKCHERPLSAFPAHF